MDVHVIFAYYSFQYFYIFRLTNLSHQIPASLLNVPFQNRISIFRNPNYVHCQPRYRMTIVPWTLAHLPNLQKCVATKVLHLKCIVSTNDCDQWIKTLYEKFSFFSFVDHDGACTEYAESKKHMSSSRVILVSLPAGQTFGSKSLTKLPDSRSRRSHKLFLRYTL